MEQILIENHNLKAQLKMLEVLKNYNDHLLKLARFLSKYEVNFISARIISFIPGTHKLIIDKGASDGLLLNHLALSVDGLIGRLSLVNEHSAAIDTLKSKNFRIAVTVGPNEYPAILYGGSELKLMYLDEKAIINEGDEVVLDIRESNVGLFPIPIATIHTLVDNSYYARNPSSTNINSRPYAVIPKVNIDNLKWATIVIADEQEL